MFFLFFSCLCELFKDECITLGTVSSPQELGLDLWSHLCVPPGRQNFGEGALLSFSHSPPTQTQNYSARHLPGKVHVVTSFRETCVYVEGEGNGVLHLEHTGKAAGITWAHLLVRWWRWLPLLAQELRPSVPLGSDSEIQVLFWDRD